MAQTRGLAQVEVRGPQVTLRPQMVLLALECLSEALSASGLTGLGKVPALLAISQSLFMGEGEAHSTPPTPPAPQLRGRG